MCQEGRGRRGRCGICFHGSWSRGREQGRKALISWLDDEDVNKFSIHILLERGFAIGVMRARIDFSMESPFA